MKIFIDGSNMWYRAYTATELYRPGGPVSVMTYMLRRQCRERGIDNVVVCWDAGDGGRKAIDPDYKANRKPVEGVWEDIVYMKTMVDILGIPNTHKKGYEADDVAGSLAVQSVDDCMILSYDKDFYQLVNNRISVLRPERTLHGKKIPRKIVDRDEVIEEFGTYPDKVTLFKAFKGDSSDNIPKLPIRFMPKFKKSLFEVISLSSSLDDFYSQLSHFDEKYHEVLLDFRKRAELNLKLITINTKLDIKVERPKLDSRKFETLCEELEIKRHKIDDWISMPKEPPPPPPSQGCLF
jgi:DNA polymerase-1